MPRSRERVRRRRRQRSALACAGVAMAVSSACGSGDSDPQAGSIESAASASVPVDGESSDSVPVDSVPAGTLPGGDVRCVVRLHGKGGSGGATSETDGTIQVLPSGNADGWGGRQWIYFPDDSYVEARGVVAEAVASEGCTTVVLNGFSNGAAFAAKLFCRGETFDGRLVGVVIDDPVPDNGAADCVPSPDVAGALYWTGGLDPQAQPGADCESIDWTCDGGTMVGIESYAASLGLDIQPSPFAAHEWYVDAPEIAAWLSN